MLSKDLKPQADVKIIDCTFRDGGHLNNWNFDDSSIRDVYRAVSKSGVDYFEIGYISSENSFDPKKYGKWKFSKPKDIAMALGSIEKGAKVCGMIDVGTIRANEIPNADSSLLDAIRVASYPSQCEEAIELGEALLVKGYEVFINLMAINYYSEESIEKIKKLISKSSIENVYFADSFGSFLPNNIDKIAGKLLGISNKKIGFHAHNNLQMAFANTLVVMKKGVKLIDATVYGMGRGAGNLPLEMFLGYMQEIDKEKYNVVPILEIIDKYFVKYRDELKWGYSLPYMLSGFWACHPNYSKDLVGMKEYAMEDIWNIMRKISKNTSPKYSKEILKEGLALGARKDKDKTTSKNTWIEVPGDKINLNSSTRATKEKEKNIEYVGRHKDRDFLVLANGPSLKEYKNEIDEIIKKYDPIILGANNLGGLFIPHYHAFTNKKRFEKYCSTVDEKSRILLSSSFPGELIKKVTKRDYEFIYHKQVDTEEFDVKGATIYTGYFTVSDLLIVIAHLMGGKRIMVAGMDGYKDISSNKTHFYDEEDEAPSLDIELEKHKACSMLIRDIRDFIKSRGKEEFHIVTPTSYSSHYKGVKNYI